MQFVADLKAFQGMIRSIVSVAASMSEMATRTIVVTAKRGKKGVDDDQGSLFIRYADEQVYIESNFNDAQVLKPGEFACDVSRLQSIRGRAKSTLKLSITKKNTLHVTVEPPQGRATVMDLSILLDITSATAFMDVKRKKTKLKLNTAALLSGIGSTDISPPPGARRAAA